MQRAVIAVPNRGFLVLRLAPLCARLKSFRTTERSIVIPSRPSSPAISGQLRRAKRILRIIGRWGHSADLKRLRVRSRFQRQASLSPARLRFR